MTDSSVLQKSYTYIAFIWEKWKIDQKFRDGFICFIHIARKCYFVDLFFAQKKKIAHLKLKEVRYKKKPISKFKTDTFDQF